MAEERHPKIDTSKIDPRALDTSANTPPVTVHKSREDAQKANEQHDIEVAKKAAEKKFAEDKAAAQRANEHRATEQQVSDQREVERKAREQADNEARDVIREEMESRDPNTYEDPAYRQSEEAIHQADIQRIAKNAPYTPQRPENNVTSESKPAPLSEQTKAEQEAGKKAVAEAVKAAAAAEKEAAKEAKKAE